MNTKEQIQHLLVEAAKLHQQIETDRHGLGAGASATLVAAWFAGKHLCEAKALVKSEYRHGQWEQHVGKYFFKSLPTSTRYMKLFNSFRCVQDLPAKSLHQVYLQLAMLTRKPRAAGVVAASASPKGHVSHAREVISHVRKILGENEEHSVKILRSELTPLRVELNRLYAGTE